MTAEAAAPGARATHVVPDGRPLALARPARTVAPAREPRATRDRTLPPEQVALLSAIRAATDAEHEAEAELARCRDARQRAVLDALREGVTKTRIGPYACRPGDAPLSRRQVTRLAEAQEPWKDQTP